MPACARRRTRAISPRSPGVPYRRTREEGSRTRGRTGAAACVKIPDIAILDRSSLAALPIAPSVPVVSRMFSRAALSSAARAAASPSAGDPHDFGLRSQTDDYPSDHEESFRTPCRPGPRFVRLPCFLPGFCSAAHRGPCAGLPGALSAQLARRGANRDALQHGARQGVYV